MIAASAPKPMTHLVNVECEACGRAAAEYVVPGAIAPTRFRATSGRLEVLRQDLSGARCVACSSAIAIRVIRDD